MSNVFEERFREIVQGINESFKPAKSLAVEPIQIRAPEIGANSSERASYMGRHYEILSNLFYGGKLNSRTFFAEHGTFYGGTKPDIVDYERKFFLESKSFSPQRSCNIMGRQILANVFLQTGEFNEYSFFYALYRHSLTGIRSTYTESEERISEDLSDKTLFSIVLPFDVILHLSIPGNSNGSKFARHYWGESYPDCICLNSKPLEELFINPENTFDGIGLKPGNYYFKRFMSPNVSINGNSVRSFPILRVERPDYGEWAESLRKDEKTLDALTEYLGRRKIDRVPRDFFGNGFI